MKRIKGYLTTGISNLQSWGRTGIVISSVLATLNLYASFDELSRHHYLAGVFNLMVGIWCLVWMSVILIFKNKI